VRGAAERALRRPFRCESDAGGKPRGAKICAMAKTVLIVEDSELNMRLFNDLLMAFGYRTVKTREGANAVALAREHKPDLIVMDIQLPEISGLDITQELKKDPELKAIPVVAVTAFAMRGDEQKILAAGCDAYLSKPISVTTFLETIRRFIG
jgi:two-component system, cell cycle response regulator DivK